MFTDETMIKIYYEIFRLINYQKHRSFTFSKKKFGVVIPPSPYLRSCPHISSVFLTLNSPLPNPPPPSRNHQCPVRLVDSDHLLGLFDVEETTTIYPNPREIASANPAFSEASNFDNNDFSPISHRQSQSQSKQYHHRNSRRLRRYEPSAVFYDDAEPPVRC